LIFLTEAEVCALLRITPRTMRNWRRSGEGPPYVRLGGLWLRYEQSAIDAWVAARTFPPVSADCRVVAPI
jgi:predicted DNA-binding transcriptional regulator AlpA